MRSVQIDWVAIKFHRLGKISERLGYLERVAELAADRPRRPLATGLREPVVPPARDKAKHQRPRYEDSRSIRACDARGASPPAPPKGHVLGSCNGPDQRAT